MNLNLCPGQESLHARVAPFKDKEATNFASDIT